MNQKQMDVLELLKRNPYLSQQEMAETLNISRPALANLISTMMKGGQILGRAYILPEEGTVICIGGANVDRKFRISKKAEMGTSNPASTVSSVGGVARNIAENLGRLGHQAKLLSVAGQDPDWQMIEAASAPYMGLELTKNDAAYTTGSYTAVLEPDGEMILAMADMAVYDQMTPEFIKRSEHALLSAEMLVLDLNCPKDTVEYVRELAKTRGLKLAIIPVSAPKMDRLGEDLSGISWLILNQDEAEKYLSTTIDSRESWEQAATDLIARGAEHVVVTAGSKGVIAAAEGSIKHYESISPAVIVDVTGAGDAFSSGIIHGSLAGEGLDEIVRTGLMNATKTLESNATVRSELSVRQLKNELEELQ